MSRSVTYAEFGENFVVATVSPERVSSAIRRIAGDTVELGPLRAGPGGAATVRAKGTIGEPRTEELDTDLLSFSVRLPVELHLDVRVGTSTAFDATGEIELHLTVLTLDPPALMIEVDPVEPSHVHFEIRSKGFQARVLERAGDVEGELRRQVAAFVNQQVASPDARRYACVELMPLIESAWETL